MKKMWKRTLSILLVALLLGGAAPLGALILRASAESYSGTCGENLTWSLDTETGELTISGTGPMRDYSYSDSPWYSRRSSVLTVTIDEGVTSIGGGAFYHCYALSSITLPDSVKSIGSSAFYNTTYYNDASNWVDDVLYIGHHLIRADTSISGSYVIADGTLCIADNAFYNCSNLTNIVIPESVTSIGNSTFYQCTSLTSITIPDSVTDIGVSAFNSCTSLSSLTIGKGVKRIESAAFKNCTDLKTVQINAINCSYMGHVAIGLYMAGSEPYPAFHGCSSLKTVAFGDMVKTIPESALADVSSLESIMIPDNATDIGKHAFFNCSRLGQIKLSANLRHIGEDAFFGTALYTDASNWTDGVLYIDNSLITTDRILSGTYTVREGTVCLADNALKDCQNLSSLEVPASVLGIGSGMFTGCRSLANIHVAAENPSYCSDNNGILYDKSKTNLIRCPAKSAIDSYVVPEGVLRIEDDAFYGCGNLLSIVLPDSVTQIGNASFSECENLETVIFPNALTTIGEKAFYHCRKLLSIDLPDCITEIGASAFNGCCRLGTVRIPLGITTIHAGTFGSCGLKHVTLGENITIVEEGAFNYNPIRNISFGPSVEQIGDIYSGFSGYYFDGRDPDYNGLESVCYSGTVEQWLGTDFGSGYDSSNSLTSAPRYYHTHVDSMPTEVRDVKEATCNSDGYSGDTVYLPCGAIKEAGRVLPALGHNYITTEPVPSCTRSTTKTVICSRCGQHDWSAETTIPAQGHLWSDGIVTEPTCTDSGYTTVTCNRCSEQDVRSWTPPLGHDWDDGVVTREATCTESGIITYTCKRDASHTRTEYTSAKGHMFGAWQQIKAPTVEAEGKAQRRCVVCGETETITLAKLPAAEKLTLNKTSVTLNYKETETLTASEAVTWSSSDEKVVKVDPTTGKLTTIGKGTATITARSVEGDKTATCEVTVRYTLIQMLIRIFLLGFLWY